MSILAAGSGAMLPVNRDLLMVTSPKYHSAAAYERSRPISKTIRF